ncbi:MAG: biliverdin-producing heme oxygenase [Lewinella sp.]|nr:biliverdin-producing heme oxygenase [Lewinella sp.]
MKVAAYLREQTQLLHRQTEALVNGAAIMQGNLSPAQYRELIQKNEFLHRQLEPLLFQLLSQYDLTEFHSFLHPRLTALEADLELLALSPASYALSAPQLSNASQTLGGLYVLLGSYLGGRVIHKALRENPHLNQITTFHFFSAGRLFPSREWPRFCSMLDQNISTAQQMEDAAEGAGKVFRFFHAVYQTNNSLKAAGSSQYPNFHYS